MACTAKSLGWRIMALVFAVVAVILVVEWQITKIVQRLRVVEKHCGIYDPDNEEYLPPLSGKRVPTRSATDNSESQRAA